MKALYILWAAVLTPIAITIVIFPFWLIAVGVAKVFGLPLPEVALSDEVAQGLLFIWGGVLTIALAITAARELGKDEQ